MIIGSLTYKERVTLCALSRNENPPDGGFWTMNLFAAGLVDASGSLTDAGKLLASQIDTDA